MAMLLYSCDQGKDLEDLRVHYKESFEKSVGDGGDTLFRKELWCGNDKLSNLFPRLYRLELLPYATIRERLGRVLNEFQSLKSLLANVSLDRNSKVKLRRSIVSNGEFKIFVWRALKNRFPTRVELDKRGIDLHSVRCPVCDGGLETVEHALVSCKFASDLWGRIFNWWKSGAFNNHNIVELLRENNVSSSMSSLGNSLWIAIKWIGVYVIWKNRNIKVFGDKSWKIPVALNEIQTLLFDWISNIVTGKKLDQQTWLSNPVGYLNLV
ncbi:uncharacterized protein [Rutidosis leptorrhynchoides]|uniref:uncharacterized protein n=1 Tax=Rutidosis leptorrhynchoides TaxID=125765 RepID=UPI003A995AAD